MRPSASLTALALTLCAVPAFAHDSQSASLTRTDIREAQETLQRDKGLNATGELDDATFDALGADADPGSTTAGAGAR
jgi:hypothetical protein